MHIADRIEVVTIFERAECDLGGSADERNSSVFREFVFVLIFAADAHLRIDGNEADGALVLAELDKDAIEATGTACDDLVGSFDFRFNRENCENAEAFAWTRVDLNALFTSRQCHGGVCRFDSKRGDKCTREDRGKNK